MEQYSNSNGNNNATKGAISPNVPTNSSTPTTPSTTSTKTLQLKKLLEVGPLNSIFSKDKDKEENK